MRKLLYILPAVLLFSYHPLISFGTDGTVNFEFSLALIWLVVFCIASAVVLIKEKKFKKLFRKENVWWVLFPAYVSLSILWSPNKLRAVLVAGVLWLIYFAIFAIFNLFEKDIKEKNFKEKFLKVFFYSAIFICFVMVLQCILDVFGAPREVTLLCKGCTYISFGFPHPNGFAIEPQFMGNLLLAPALTLAYGLFSRSDFPASRTKLFIVTAGLFLTMSRGAIYAFSIAMILMTILEIVRIRKGKETEGGAKKGLITVWLITIFAFLFTLNLQGILAQASKTDDTYFTGISKVINQLTLGKIDPRDLVSEETEEVVSEETATEEITVEEAEGEVVRKSEFSGYVEISTTGRLNLSAEALEVFSRDVPTMLFGFGLGGTGVSLFNAGLSQAPGEVAQSEYIAILTEFGIVGAGLFIFTLVLIVREIMKRKDKMVILALFVAYLITAAFFSGLPNALHMYLITAMLMAL